MLLNAKSVRKVVVVWWWWCVCVCVLRKLYAPYLHVLWCHHGVKLDGLIAAKYLVRPATHGAYELDGTDAIIGDENFLDRTLPSERLHELGWRGNLRADRGVDGSLPLHAHTATAASVGLQMLTVHSFMLWSSSRVPERVRECFFSDICSHTHTAAFSVTGRKQRD